MGQLTIAHLRIFHDATRMAKVVSERFRTTVVVARECSQWRVFILADEELTYDDRARLMKNPLRKEYPYDADGELRYSCEPEERAYSNDVAQEILEDIFDYQDSVARTVDDGWYYSDD